MTYTATADQAKGIIEGRIASVIVPMRPQPPEGAGVYQYPDSIIWHDQHINHYKSPYFVGCEVAVREPWCCEIINGTFTGRYLYAADGKEVMAVDDNGMQRFRQDGSEASPWISPVQMPADAVRVFITPQSIQPVQVCMLSDEQRGTILGYPLDGSLQLCCPTLEVSFENCWDRRYGHHYPYATSWAWVVEFKRVVRK